MRIHHWLGYWIGDAYVALLHVNPPLAWIWDFGCLCSTSLCEPPAGLDFGCLCSSSLCESPTGLDFGLGVFM